MEVYITMDERGENERRNENDCEMKTVSQLSCQRTDETCMVQTRPRIEEKIVQRKKF